MMEKENDIYISYRRDDGWQYAVALQGMLSQQGYRTYYQVERWSSGRCDEETYNAIQSSSVIVMLLTPGYIGGLCIERHYVSEEMAFAVKEHKRIISIVPDKYDRMGWQWSPNVPEAFQDAVNNPFVMHFNDRMLLVDSMDKLIKEKLAPIFDELYSDDLLKNYAPQKVDYDIFISYRREDGREQARSIKLALQVHGYRNIFFDYESIQKGEFTKRIIDAIYSCNDFILVLSPNSMLRCGEEGDPVANEIRAAAKYKKNIIPLTLDNKPVIWPKSFPNDLEFIRSIHFHDHKSDSYFDDSIDDLCTKLTTKLD